MFLCVGLGLGVCGKESGSSKPELGSGHREADQSKPMPEGDKPLLGWANQPLGWSK
jgi:hypothetical protein